MDSLMLGYDAWVHILHNGIDWEKIGGYDFSKCYISYSGRMPADMLIKVIRVGIPIIISNAAPASSGIDVARSGNITMIGFVRDNRFTVYTAPERVNLKK